MTLPIDKAKAYADYFIASMCELDRLRLRWALSKSEKEKADVLALRETNREQAKIALLVLTRSINEEQAEAMLDPLITKEKELKALIPK